jgi:dipeptidyl aminopeptidase/acylaminoacyl peptidase
MMNDEAVIERLVDAVGAYTADAGGRPDSLEALFTDPITTARRRRSLVSMPALAASVAAAVAGIVVAATSLHGPDGSSAPPARAPGIAVLSSYHLMAPTSERYPAAAYFVTRKVTKLTSKVLQDAPAVARTSDLKVVRTLPLSLMSAHLSADGSRMFGFYFGSGNGAGTANSGSNDQRVRALVNRDNAEHAVYVDFATGDVVELGRAAWPGITGMTVTPDGRTIAYARIAGAPHGTENAKAGGEHSIIRVVDVATGRGREFTVPKQRQVLGLALSPDGRQLAFTETRSGNILFLADLSQPNPAATAVPLTPPQPCLKGAYDFPTWTGAGLFAERECEPDARGLVADVVRIDPRTTLPAGAPLAPLPRGGASALAVLTTASGLEFGFLPVRSSTPYDSGDARVTFRNNEVWVIAAGATSGHRTGLLWGP